MQSWLKLSESIKVVLVPANDLYHDKKGFIWSLKSYDDTHMSLKVDFKHPNYISVGGSDTLKITYSNTDKYFKPVDN